MSRVKHWGHRHHEIFRKYVESLIQLDCMNGSVVASSSGMFSNDSDGSNDSVNRSIATGIATGWVCVRRVGLRCREVM